MNLVKIWWCETHNNSAWWSEYSIVIPTFCSKKMSWPFVEGECRMVEKLVSSQVRWGEPP